MKIKVLFITLIGLMVGVVFLDYPPNPSQTKEGEEKTIIYHVPPCLEVYEQIEIYSDSFDIPKQYAYGIAYNETGYRGPFHYKYNPAQTSSANAVGPMQVKVNTARHVNKDEVTIDKLRTDVEYNIMTSMKLLRKLKNKYGDWKLVFGAYNTGSPLINDYALRVYNHKINWK